MIFTQFTPWSALFGGVLIGAAAVLMMWLLGRIAGISGIVQGLLPPYRGGSFVGSAAFVAGLIVAPSLYYGIIGVWSPPTLTLSPWMIGLSGLLVGFGTVCGYGCTSGHGVCGTARLSARSFVATGVFMAVAMITATIVYR